MPSWIPYASNWISCNNCQKTNFEPVPRLLAVGFYVISQPILDFGLSCGTLRERLTSTYLSTSRSVERFRTSATLRDAQSNDFGFVSPTKALWDVPLRGSKLRVSVSKSCLGQGMNQKI
ncbi:MAG: hypothetical protein V7K92_15740 [Nostoc sp.]|uniref:hypothetical protein n=1 Tax=Nostoc sp. TaxID=1180 RepID=UPI002FEF5366